MKTTKKHFTLEPGETLYTPDTPFGQKNSLYIKKGRRYIRLNNAIGLIVKN